ncbi:MAG: hypothetical protein WDO19_21765 [Bacteroidota bacterium]
MLSDLINTMVSPTLFFFNFNGYSGKFYFQDDRSPVVVSGEDLKIEYYYPMGWNVELYNAGSQYPGIYNYNPERR